MNASNRLGTVAAISLVTATCAVLLTACGPDDPSNAPSVSGAPTGVAASGASPTKSGKPVVTVNGTSAANHLTISDGTENVVMNGTTVNFGTKVRDLVWSWDGKKAAFVDGNGDLVIANPDGSGKVTVAKNPGGETWSHPTWMHVAKGPCGGCVPDETERFNTIVFAAAKGNDLRLKRIPAKAVNGMPEVLTPDNAEEGAAQPPQAGNTWPSTGGQHGEVAYANTPANEVYLYDDYIRPSTQKLAKGSQPAMSADGGVVFVRSVGGHDHLFLGGKSDKDLTPNATTDYTEPTWSPDGKTIAARTPDGIVTLPADGSAAPTQISTYKGLAAYRP